MLVIHYVFYNSFAIHLYTGSCIDGTVRLSGSSVEIAGRVEICLEEIWTSLCDQSWDFKDAQVVCRELGYSPYGLLLTTVTVCFI